jgi:hypothetical protein
MEGGKDRRGGVAWLPPSRRCLSSGDRRPWQACASHAPSGMAPMIIACSFILGNMTLLA